jgi:hypothetical protein
MENLCGNADLSKLSLYFPPIFQQYFCPGTVDFAKDEIFRQQIIHHSVPAEFRDLEKMAVLVWDQTGVGKVLWQ